MKILLLALLVLACGQSQAIDWPDDGGYRPKLVKCDNPNQVSYSGFTIKGCYDSNRTLIMGNGTNAPCGFYREAQLSAARRGYLTICPETGRTRDGEKMVDAFNYLRDKGSNAEYVLLSGHSQGASSSFSAAYKLQRRYPYLTVDILGIYPYFWAFYDRELYNRIPKVKGRKIVLRGTRDTTSTLDIVMRGYRLIEEPKRLIEVPKGHLDFNPEYANMIKLFD